MLRGLLYDASREELTQERLAAKELCFAYNRTPPSDETRQRELMRRLARARPASVLRSLHRSGAITAATLSWAATILLVNLGSLLILRFRSR